MLAGSARAGAPSDASLAELIALVEAEPGDADLAWALVRAHEARGEGERAAERLEGYLERWPERRPGAWARLGRLRYERGLHAEAVDALERAIELRALDATAQLYRGMALRALGRGAEAERALLVAGRLDPSLEAETLLLRGLGSLEQGDTEKGRELLRAARALAPAAGETARQAELLLGATATDARASDRLKLTAYAGVEADSNVTLEGEQVPGAPSDESDSRAVWGAGLAYRALDREAASATVGYRYGESAQQDLRSYNVQSHLLFASASFHPRERLRLRLDALATDLRLNDERYLRTWTARPNLMYALGERAGLSRLYLELERSDYHHPPALRSLERGGVVYGAGLEHYVMLPGWREAWAAVGVRLTRTRTEASRDLLGFSSAYDAKRRELTLQLHAPLRWGIEADLSATLARERYAHRNLIDGLFSSPSLAAAERRRDRDLETSIGLSRALTKLTRVELRYRGARERSNVPVYSYDRHIVGLYVRAETR